MRMRRAWLSGAAIAACVVTSSCVSPHAGVLPLPVPAPPSTDESKGGRVGAALSNEQIRRGAEESYGLRCLREGAEELDRGMYRRAVPLFIDAVQYLGSRPETAEHLQRAKAGLGESYYRWALVLAKSGDGHQAAEYARRAAGFGHEGAAEFLRLRLQQP